MTQSINKSTLEKPGAGLPSFERMLLNLGFKLMRTFKSRIGLNDMFHKEFTKLVALAETIPADKGEEPVLIKRVKGMEDSSRNWSAYMVFEHLHIVNTTLLSIVETLLKEETFQGAVKTENVKPSPSSTIQSIENFSHSAQQYLGTLQTLDSLKTKTTHKHPWFGELDAHGWHTLATIHMQVHRKQLEQIIVDL